MVKIIEIESVFIGDFPVGDEIVADCNVLVSLCAGENYSSVRKPIVVWIAAIAEACLQQIIYRAQNFTREGVSQISDEELDQIRGKKLDKLNNIIEAFRARGLLDDLGDDIYDRLHLLRRMRNRIHIQDRSKLPIPGKRDKAVFTHQRVQDALKLLRDLLMHLARKFPRSPEKNHVLPLRIPIFEELD